MIGIYITLWGRHAVAHAPTSIDVLESPQGNDIVIEILDPQSAETVAKDEILDTSKLQSTTETAIVDKILDTSELQSSIDSMPETKSLDQKDYIQSSDVGQVEIEGHADTDF
ncbi:hypothetical protein V6N13_121592 [Hibiscus sabdariffa]|uniref:Uncharacterized protein n=2 Tax=Hibiscus sabdariffa TaxID=183260 RepID=A0ABR2PDC1_9ROSI